MGIQMKKDIIEFKQYFISTLLPSNDNDNTLKEFELLLQRKGIDDEKDDLFDDDDSITNRRRKRHKNTRIHGGAKMTVKRAIQKNLNINWSDTIRNALLFLFFGYFGIRKNDTFTKTIMIYYAAPLCFIIQLRFIKIFFK